MRVSKVVREYIEKEVSKKANIQRERQSTRPTPHTRRNAKP